MIETKPSGALVSWSGGKDSCYAAMLALEQGYSLRALLNVMNESGQRSRSHGLPLYVLQQQAAAAGLPLHAIESSWNDYEKKFTDALATLRDAHAVDYAVFGDIDLQPHRDWEEKVTSAVGLQALLPLWQQDRGELLHRMLASGIRTIIVSCQERMGIDFLGKTLSHIFTGLHSQEWYQACDHNRTATQYSPDRVCVKNETTRHLLVCRLSGSLERVGIFG